MSEEIIETIEETDLETTEEQTEEPAAPPELDSKYRLIIVAARRSKQLQRGARARVEMDAAKHKVTRVAMAEVMAGKVNYSVLEDN